MPRDDLANETSQLSITRPDEGQGNNLTSFAAARLAREAQDSRRGASTYIRPRNQDVTRGFVAASQQLQPGQLIKDEHFTLFEAVGALEIMDSKMDSGFVPPNDSFEADFDVCSGLSGNEVLWIMDELFRLEMNLHDGYPIAQNLFTSLHVFRLLAPETTYPYTFNVSNHSGKYDGLEQQLVHLVLRAYCIGVIKCCQLTMQLIQAYTFFEEEDFVTYLFGRELLPRLDFEEASKMLTDASEWLSRSQVDDRIKPVLLDRMLLRQHLLTSMMGGTIEGWHAVKADISRLGHDRRGGTPAPEAFSYKVQRQLASSTPPRPMPDLSWDAACTKWVHLCDDILAAFESTSVPTRHNPHCLQRAAWAFAYRNPQPNTYARAKMQELLTGNDAVADDVPQFDLLLMDIRDLVLAGDPLTDPANFQIDDPTDVRYRCSRLIGDFMSRAFGEYVNIYRMLCQNRCRMRRTFTQAVPILDGLETVARDTDRLIHELISPRRLQDYSGETITLEPLTHWMRFYKLQTMESVIQLGYETDLYLVDEFGTTYAVLASIISKRNEMISNLNSFGAARAASLQDDRNQTALEECLGSLEWLRSLYLMSSVHMAVARALCSLYGSLESTGVINISPKPYHDSQLHYEARLKPLLNLAHDILPDTSAIDAAKGMNGRTVDESQAMVKTAIEHARGHLAELKLCSPTAARYLGTEDRWKQELKQIETVCVAITVAASQLANIWQKHCKTNVDLKKVMPDVVDITIPPPGQRYHDWWVVPKLRERS